MSNTSFVVPALPKLCWLDYRFLAGGYGWRGDRPLGTITDIVLHHTVTQQRNNANREFMEIWQHRRYGGTAYHILVSSEEKDGYAIAGYMGDLGSIRAHAVNSKGKDGKPKNQGNNYSIGISFVGDHRAKMPTPAMLKTAKLVIEELFRDARFSKLNSWDNVVGHGYWDQTWCPDGQEGKILEPLIKNINTNMSTQWDHFLGWNAKIKAEKKTDRVVEIKEAPHTGASGLINDLSVTKDQENFLIQLMDLNNAIPQSIRNTAWLDQVMARYALYLVRSQGR